MVSRITESGSLWSLLEKQKSIFKVLNQNFRGQGTLDRCFNSLKVVCKYTKIREAPIKILLMDFLWRHIPELK